MKDKNGKELRGAAKHTHQIYTIEDGPKNHDDIQQTKGIVKATAAILIGLGIKRLVEKIENMELKVNKPRKGE